MSLIAIGIRKIPVRAEPSPLEPCAFEFITKFHHDLISMTDEPEVWMPEKTAALR